MIQGKVHKGFMHVAVHLGLLPQEDGPGCDQIQWNELILKKLKFFNKIQKKLLKNVEWSPRYHGLFSGFKFLAHGWNWPHQDDHLFHGESQFFQILYFFLFKSIDHCPSILLWWKITLLVAQHMQDALNLGGEGPQPHLGSSGHNTENILNQNLFLDFFWPELWIQSGFAMCLSRKTTKWHKNHKNHKNGSFWNTWVNHFKTDLPMNHKSQKVELN